MGYNEENPGRKKKKRHRISQGNPLDFLILPSG
jgi:hypothetical protein